MSSKLYHINSVDYSVVEAYFLDHQFNRAPAELVQKLVALDVLRLSSELRDRTQFGSLLRYCKCLKTLIVSAPFMDQSFFDSILTENCRVIESLIVKNSNQLNFDFLLKFADLQNFKTEQQLPAGLVSKMFDKFESLKTLNFSFQGSSAEIRIYERTAFKLRLDEVRKLFASLDALLEYLKSNHRPIVLTEEEGLGISFLFLDP